MSDYTTEEPTGGLATETDVSHLMTAWQEQVMKTIIMLSEGSTLTKELLGDMIKEMANLSNRIDALEKE